MALRVGRLEELPPLRLVPESSRDRVTGGRGATPLSDRRSGRHGHRACGGDTAQPGRQLRRVRARRRRLCEARRDEVDERVRRVGQDVDEVRPQRCDGRRRPQETEPGECPEGVHVGRSAGRFSVDDLGSDEPVGGPVGPVGACRDTRGPQVCDRRASLVVEEDVGRGEVGVHASSIVETRHGRRDRSERRHALADGESAASSHDVVEAAAGHVLEHERAVALGARREIEGLDDVGPGVAPQHPPFRTRGDRGFRADLDRDGALRPGGAPHRRAAALPDERFDGVSGDRGCGGVGHGDSWVRRARGAAVGVTGSTVAQEGRSVRRVIHR